MRIFCKPVIRSTFVSKRQAYLIFCFVGPAFAISDVLKSTDDMFRKDVYVSFMGELFLVYLYMYIYKFISIPGE